MHGGLSSGAAFHLPSKTPLFIPCISIHQVWSSRTGTGCELKSNQVMVTLSLISPLPSLAEANGCPVPGQPTESGALHIPVAVSLRRKRKRPATFIRTASTTPHFQTTVHPAANL
jgi:hypothetical protein